MKEVRIGIVGLGAVSSAHLSAYDFLDNVNIVSVCDVKPEKAIQVAKKYKARAYSDYKELLANGGIDLVLVLTPALTHREVVSAAAKARIHVQCEKPLAVTLDDAEAMVSQLSDGASAAVIMDSGLAEQKGLEPLGIYRGLAVAGCEPDEMGIGPVFAVPKLLKRNGLTMDDIGLWELNEAFAVQVLYCREKLNIL